MGIAAQLAKNKAQRVIGIDCSTKSLAYSIFDNKELIEYGEISFDGADTFERLADGQSRLSEIKDKFKADIIVMESAVYVQNKKTVILLAYSFGAILSAILHKGCKVEEFTPTEWQFAIGNKVLTAKEKQELIDETPGKSKSWYKNRFREFRKQRTADWVKDKFDIEIESDNITDAIAIGYVGAERFS